MTSDSAGTTTYTYDGKNRLGTATIGGVKSQWFYDDNGNRLSAAITTGGSTTTTFSAYNAADEICWTSTAATATTPCTSPPAGATTYGFDASGNQTGDALSGVAANNSFNVFNQVVTTNVTSIGAQNSSYTDTFNSD